MSSNIRQPNNWESYRERTAAFAAGHKVGAVSGVGSTPQATAPLVKFLLGWLASHADVHTMVEASCGHWASGWQSKVHWPALDYFGVDIVREQVDANAQLVEKVGLARLGLRSAKFIHANMTMDVLPAADWLLSKDTLIHMPLADIERFLRLSVARCPPIFKYAMFVHEQPLKKELKANVEIGRNGHHALDFALPPFSLNVSTVFVYPSGRCCKKAVQLLDLTRACE